MTFNYSAELSQNSKLTLIDQTNSIKSFDDTVFFAADLSSPE